MLLVCVCVCFSIQIQCFKNNSFALCAFKSFHSYVYFAVTRRDTRVTKVFGTLTQDTEKAIQWIPTLLPTLLSLVLICEIISG